MTTKKKTSLASAATGALASAAAAVLTETAQAAAAQVKEAVTEKINDAAGQVVQAATDAVSAAAEGATSKANEVIGAAAQAASDISALPDGTPVNKLGFHLDRIEEVLGEFFKEATADVIEVGNSLRDLRDRIERLPADVIEAVTG